MNTKLMLALAISMAMVPLTTALDGSNANHVAYGSSPNQVNEEFVEPIQSSVQTFTIDMGQVEERIDDGESVILPLSLAAGIGMPLERMTDFLLNGTDVYDENGTFVETKHFEHFRHREPGLTAVFGWSGQSLTGYIQVCNAVFDYIPVGNVAGQVEVHVRTQGGFKCPTNEIIQKLDAAPCMLPYATCDFGEGLEEMDPEAIAEAVINQIPTSIPAVLPSACDLSPIVDMLCGNIDVDIPCIPLLQPGCEPGGGGNSRSPSETRGARDKGDELPSPVNGDIKVHYWTDNDFRAASNDASLVVSTAYAAQAEYMDEYLGIALGTLTEHTFNVNGNWFNCHGAGGVMEYFAGQLGAPSSGTAIHAFYSGHSFNGIGCALHSGTDGVGRSSNDRPIVVSTADYSNSNGRFYWGLSPRDVGLLTAHESAHVWGQTHDMKNYVSACGGSWFFDETYSLMCDNPDYYLQKDFWAWFGGTTGGTSPYKFRTIDFVVDGFSEIPH